MTRVEGRIGHISGFHSASGRVGMIRTFGKITGKILGTVGFSDVLAMGGLPFPVQNSERVTIVPVGAEDVTEISHAYVRNASKGNSVSLAGKSINQFQMIHEFKTGGFHGH